MGYSFFTSLPSALSHRFLARLNRNFPYITETSFTVDNLPRICVFYSSWFTFRIGSLSGMLSVPTCLLVICVNSIT
ncbi:hypothetical protein A0H81_12315 [Grifola frondosa]|uniref:Uncharacterized protein n=1 Tax=Grifola frondosa TaxID=5627 RepID=A0A1C7LTG0_GRIFR|nr:hypothetical protein A0H81_12315 [Grifola frondosa]